ncbi:MAG: DUF4340 domain-containing protein [Deltaproteobacteria bacterium]|nr:DUF4340 domain-containing protein [Deltaproteobacteria bacterium]
MKKSTIYLLVAAVVLAVVTFLVTREGAPPPPKKIDIPGYAKPEDLEAERMRGIMDSPVEITHPIDEVILTREAAHPSGVTVIHLVRSGAGKDATWRLKSPVDAPAVKYQVERIIEVFKAPTASKYARALKESDQARYDFEPARRVRVTLKSQGAVWNGVDLVVGRLEKGEATPQGEAQADTWVMRADDPATAYLLAGKDLRTPADADLASLRDKKVFSFEADDVTRIEITPPDGKKVALAGTRSETPPAPDDTGAVPPDAKPTIKVDWALVEPAGVVGDQSISSYARSLASLRVNDFVPLAKADEAAKKALAGKLWRVKLDVVPGGSGEAQSHTVLIEEGGGDVVWAQVEGKDELLSLQSYSAKNLRKGLDELANKVVFDVVPEDVTSVTLGGDAGPITVTKTGEAWAFTAPALPHPADPTTLLKQLGKLTAVRWARDDELEAARAAVAAPDFEARLETKAGVAHAIRFGKLPEGEAAERNRWAVVGDPATAKPFLVADHNAKRYRSDVTALRHKKLLAAKKDDVARVELTSPDGVVTVLERPAAEAGGGELVVVPLPEGKKTKEDAARTLAATLGALDAKSFHDGKALSEAALDNKPHKLVVTLADGSSTTLLVSAKSAGEGEVFAIVDRGPLANVVVGINEYQAKNLTKAAADLVEDAGAAPAPMP